MGEEIETPETLAAKNDRPAGRGSSPRLAERTPEVTLLTWSSSLRQRRPKTFLIGLLATALALGLTWVAFPGEVGFLLLAGMMMGGALGPLYFPIRFRFTDKKVYQRIFFSEEGHRWADFEDHSVFDQGVYLRLRASDLRLRYLKGMTLYFGPKNREEVLEHVRRQMGAASESEGGKADSRAEAFRTG